MAANGSTIAAGVRDVHAGASQIAGAIISGTENERVYKLNQAELRRSQAIEWSNYASELRVGAFQAGAARMRGSALLGQQRAAYASAGVDTTSGTALQQQVATGTWAEVDAATAMGNARRAAQGHAAAARRYATEAQVQTEQYQAQQTANTVQGVIGGLNVVNGVAQIVMGAMGG